MNDGLACPVCLQNMLIVRGCLALRVIGAPFSGVDLRLRRILRPEVLKCVRGMRPGVYGSKECRVVGGEF